MILERDVEIAMDTGTCDAAFFCPDSGTHPGVLLWTDAFGLRPVTRDIARRLAAEGFAVLVPNPFYRVAKAPVVVTPYDFSVPSNLAHLYSLMGTVTAEGAAEADATKYIGFLDAQPQVNRSAKLGTQGYCMGGALACRTAALMPERVGAVASLHGGGLVTDKPGSPHLLAVKMKAAVYVGVAKNDDEKQPEAKDLLRAAFAEAGLSAEVQVVPALHGWCMKDMPLQNGEPIWNEDAAGKSFEKVVSLYRAAGLQS